MGNISLSLGTDAEILRTLGARLRALRKSQKLSSQEAAAQSGLSRRTIYRAEQGENPTLETLVRLLRLYGHLGSLAQLVPEPEISPMALIRRRPARPRG